jgi:hypothetical protein
MLQLKITKCAQEPAAMSRTVDAFIVRLAADQRQIFEDLSVLLKHRSPPLSQRYRIGQCVLAWRRAVRQNKPGNFAGLAEALDTSATQLVKAASFAEDYTSREARELEEQGVTWGLVVATQQVKKEERPKLFRKALKERWNAADLALLVNQKRRGGRHAGGRPPRTPPTLELGLQQMRQLCSRWLKFHRQVWPNVRSSAAQKGRGRKLQALLSQAQRAVADVEKAAKEVQDSLMTPASAPKTRGKGPISDPAIV